jgi:hypothetical protein
LPPGHLFRRQKPVLPVIFHLKNVAAHVTSAVSHLSRGLPQVRNSVPHLRNAVPHLKTFIRQVKRGVPTLLGVTLHLRHSMSHLKNATAQVSRETSQVSRDVFNMSRDVFHLTNARCYLEANRPQDSRQDTQVIEQDSHLRRKGPNAGNLTDKVNNGAKRRTETRWRGRTERELSQLAADGRRLMWRIAGRLMCADALRLGTSRAPGVGQAFQPAGSPDFRVRCLERATGKSPAPADRNVCPTRVVASGVPPDVEGNHPAARKSHRILCVIYIQGRVNGRHFCRCGAIG